MAITFKAQINCRNIEERLTNEQFGQMMTELGGTILIPYVREFISSLTSRGFGDTVTIPPMDVEAAMHKGVLEAEKAGAV